MADGRDVQVWDNHAEECREAERTHFEFPEDTEEGCGGWLRSRVLKIREEMDPKGKAVDVGCGPGYWKKLFAGFDYTGFDQSTGMLKLAAELSSEATWVQGNARSLSSHFDSETFDVAFTASVLQHNRHLPDKRDIVEGISTILKPGGYLVCTENTLRADNCPQSVGNPDYTDGYSFTPRGWESFMAALGFELLEFNGQSEYLFRKSK